MSPAFRFDAALAGTVALLALSAPAQRGLTPITSSGESHQEARVSPNGQAVAFRGPGKIGVVAYGGGVEATLVSSNNLGSFLWSRASLGIYFIEDTDLKFVGRSGGNPLRLAQLPGQQHFLWCIDSKDTTIWGSRFDPSTTTWRIFTVDASGASAPVDIVISNYVLDQVRIDSDDARILYREGVPTPFTPAEYWSADPDGTNRTSLTGGPIPAPLCPGPELGDWVDAGQSIAFTMVPKGGVTTHLMRIGPSGTQIVPLTDGPLIRRNSAVTYDRTWILHQAQYPGGATLGILPVDGGGLILMSDDAKTYLFHGPPSADASGTRFAVAATELGGSLIPQIYTAGLDRELRIAPRVVTGGSFSVQMPLAMSEVGIVFIATGVAPQKLVLPNVTYGLALDATLLPLLGGGPGSSSLGISLQMPNLPAVVGLSLYFQGLRLVGPTFGSGDFTRYAEARIF